MRILLIEDDRRLAESVKFQLEKEGFTVDHCEAGDANRWSPRWSC